ncbi:MAG TPA: hypothetical protein VIE43_06460 [Thermoanaerobaculia bacterium]|nr:hypothetical protein [Thermoanaerobaculia bacterium]
MKTRERNDMVKSFLVVVGIAAVGAFSASAQVTGGHVDPAALAAASGKTDVQSPMKLTIALGPDAKHPGAVLDLPDGYSRKFTQTAQFVMEEASVPEVRIGKRGSGKKESLNVTVQFATTKFRQKLSLRVALVGDGGEVWQWADPAYVLGFTAGDAVFGGGLGVASSAASAKTAKIEQSIPLTPEMRKSLGSNPRLEIVVATVE